jgi:hypothetical protein
VDPSTGVKNSVTFAPGVAVLHRGKTMHAAVRAISITHHRLSVSSRLSDEP